MKIIKLVLLLTIFVHGSFAMAKKKRAPKAYSFIAEAGKASQSECDGEGSIPRKLKHQKDISKSKSYMGSELMEPFIQTKESEEKEMWKHFFRDKASCNAVLSKTPSARGQSQVEKKPDLPPDDSVDSEEDADDTGSSDAGSVDSE